MMPEVAMEVRIEATRIPETEITRVLKIVEKTREELAIQTIKDWDGFYGYIRQLGEVVVGNTIYDAEAFIIYLKRARDTILNNPPDLVEDEEIIRCSDMDDLTSEERKAFIKANKGKILKNPPYLIKVINWLGSAKSFIIRNAFSTLIMNDLESIRINTDNVIDIRKNFAMHVLSNET